MTFLPEFIGESPGILAVQQTVERLLARAREGRRLPPILLQGETGTGKGLLARALHRAGPRTGGPFVDVNCAAIPGTLLEAELFGYERGAFTDARQGKAGLFQTAHRGTLFLDEVGLLPEALQGKLLTVLEGGVVRRLGATRAEPVDVWVLAASNADLAAATRAGRFREDLYHRLAVVTVSLPPLRERGADVLRLVEHYLGRACADYRLPAKVLTAEAQAALLGYAWPGNVRELANVMERVALLGEGQEVTAAMLALPAAPSPEPGEPARTGATVALTDAVESVEREHLLEALRQTHWNISRAAARLGLPRNTLRYRIEKYGLRPGAASPPRRPRRGERPAVAPALPEAVPVPTEPGPAPVGIRWERRSVSLLRVALAAPSGPAVTADIGRVAEILVEKVQSFGGRVEELSPMGITAAFGLEPVEDAPRRAALAAITIQKAAERGWGRDAEGITVRVGIHTGELMLGRVNHATMLDQDAKREAWAVLEALIERAPPGSILVSGAAGSNLERRFELVPLPVPEQSPVRAFRLGGGERTGFELWGRIAQFVERRHELELLRERWAAAVRGHGQVVGIIGEAGIGKSRLLFEFRQRLIGEPVRYLEGDCLSYASTVSYFPVLSPLRGCLQLEERDDPAAVRDKVTTKVTGLDQALKEAIPPILALFEALPEGHPFRALAAAERRQRTLDAVKRLLLRESQIQPLLLVIEDVHWSDSETQAVLEGLVESLPAARILLLLSYRPEYRHGWGSKTYYTQLSLEPLSPRSASELVEALLGSDASLAPTRQLLVERAEGNPFFLEESIRSLVETGALVGKPGAYRLVEPVERIQVPATVEALLAARIDRLPPEERQLIQSASVIGKDVPFPLLQAIAGLSEDALNRSLARLLASEFLYESRVVPWLEHTFKHALTYEVAYGSLLPHERTVLHAKIVGALERLLGDRVGEEAEVLAHHALRGELWDKAVDYLREAGAKAFGRAALLEAISHLTKGLDLVATLPENPERRRQELSLLITLGPVLINAKGPRTREVAQTYSRALELCSQLPESTQHFTALWGSWRISESFHTKHELAAMLLELAEGLGDPGLRLQAHHCLWATSFHLGQHQAACEHVEKGLHLYEAGDYRSHASIYGGHDPKVCGIGERAFALWLLGFPDQSLAASQEATAWALQLAHAGTLVHAMDMSLLLDRYRRDPHTVQGRAEELIRYSEDQGFSVHKAKGTVFLGWALAEVGQTEQGIGYMCQGLEEQRAVGTHEDFPVLFDMLAAAYAAAGRAQLGLDVLGEVLAETERSGLSYWTAELYRRRGEVLMALSREHEAEAEICIRRALEVARGQQAKSLELRAAMSLARLEQSRGRPAAAYELVAPVFAWFREGFETADLREARALLNDLAPSAAGAAGHTWSGSQRPTQG